MTSLRLSQHSCLPTKTRLLLGKGCGFSFFLTPSVPAGQSGCFPQPTDLCRTSLPVTQPLSHKADKNQLGAVGRPERLRGTGRTPRLERTGTNRDLQLRSQQTPADANFLSLKSDLTTIQSILVSFPKPELLCAAFHSCIRATLVGDAETPARVPFFWFGRGRKNHAISAGVSVCGDAFLSLLQLCVLIRRNISSYKLQSKVLLCLRHCTMTCALNAGDNDDTVAGLL